MAIIKNYTNSRGFALAYHRVVQVVVTADQVLATLHSWPNKGCFEALLGLFPSAMIETINVPRSALSFDPLVSIESWFMENESSPLFGGSFDADVMQELVIHAANN